MCSYIIGILLIFYKVINPNSPIAIKTIDISLII